MHHFAAKTFTMLGLSCALLFSSDNQKRNKEILFVRDENLIQGKFSNGLSYYIKRNGFDQKKASLRLAVKVGSVFEDEGERGLAHFIEHMVFRGSTHFADGEVVKFLESIGASFGGHTNAYTSFDETVYMLDIPLKDKKHLEKAISILADFASNALFLKECLDVERGVVLDEMRLRKSQAGMRGSEKLIDLLLKESIYGERQPIGIESVIQSCQREDLVEFYHKWYQPENIAIIVAGDFEPEEVFFDVEKKFSLLKKHEKTKQLPNPVLEKYNKTEVQVAHNPENLRAMLYMARIVDGPTLETLSDFKTACIDDLIFMIFNRRLEIQKEEDPDSFENARGSFSKFVNKKDLVALTGVCWEKSPLKSIELLLTQYKWMCEDDIDPSELEIVRSALRAAIEIDIQNGDKIQNHTLVSQYLSHFLDHGSLLSFEDQRKLTLDLLEKISMDELNLRRKELFSLSDCKIIYFPSEQAKPVTEQEITALFSQKQQQRTQGSDKLQHALFEKKEEQGSIIEEKKYTQTEVEFLKLSNGMKVYLHPTKLKNNVFSYQLVAEGGLNAFEEKNIYSALCACDFLKKSGVGGLSATQLQDLLAGKNLRISPFFSVTERRVTGYCSNQDMKTLFPLLNALFTKRDFKENAWSALLQSSDQYFDKIEKNSEIKFHNKIFSTSYKDHYFFKPYNSRSLSKEKAIEALESFFGDPGEFSLVISGDFDKTELLNNLKTHLATIKKNRSYPTPIFMDFGNPEGKLKEIVQGEVSFNESHVSLHFPLNLKGIDVSASLFYKQTLLDNILSRKLLEGMRSKLGETYSIHLASTFMFYPQLDSARLMIQFSTQNGREDAMIDQLFVMIDHILKEPILQEDIDKARNIYLHEVEKTLLTNEGRIERILKNQYFSEDLDHYVSEAIIEEIVEPKDLEALLHHELDKDNYVLCIKKG